MAMMVSLLKMRNKEQKYVTERKIVLREATMKILILIFFQLISQSGNR